MTADFQASSTRFLLRKKDKVLFVGHSLMSRFEPPYQDTWPFLRLMDAERTWNDTFAEILFCLRPDLQLSFNTVYGTSMAEVLKRYDACVAPFAPQWVILGTGDNDARMNVPLEAFTADVTRFCQATRELSRCRTVFLGGKLVDDGTAAFDAKSAPYHQALHALAPAVDGIYIDFESTLQRKRQQLQQLYSGHTIHGPDGHLNRIGNLIVAWKVLAELGFTWEE